MRRWVVAFCLLTVATSAEAYVGPGMGLGVIGAVLGFLTAIFLAFAGMVWYPVKRLLRALTPRGILRQLLIRLPPRTSLRATDALVHALLPVHRMLWRHGPVADRVRAVWLRLSPLFDYYESYPELGEHLAEWALLDTHDGLTDHYKHGRTPSELAKALRAAGLEVIDSRKSGNGAEARALRPERRSRPRAFAFH